MTKASEKLVMNGITGNTTYIAQTKCYILSEHRLNAMWCEYTSGQLIANKR